MKILLLAFVSIFPFSAFAAFSEGGQEGNGGDVVVCPGQKAELLDFYEARTLRGIQVEPTTEADPLVILKNLLAEYRAGSPELIKRLEVDLDSFFSNTIFLNGVTLTDIPDSRHVALPAGCTIEQIAIQRAPAYPQDKRYTINGDLWTLLPPLGQAGLILHEILFTRGLEGGITHSMDIRYLNSLFFSRLYKNLNDRDRYNVLFRSRMPLYDLVGEEARLILPVYYRYKYCGDGATDSTCTSRSGSFPFQFDETGRLSKSSLNTSDLSAEPELIYGNGLRFNLSENYGATYSRMGAGFLVEITNEDKNASIEEKKVSFRGLQRLEPKQACGQEPHFSVSAVELSFYPKGACLSFKELLQIIKEKPTLESLAGKRYYYRPSSAGSLIDFFPKSRGKWVAREKVDSVEVKSDGENTTIRGSFSWMYADGELRPYRGGNSMLLDLNGDPVFQSGTMFNGKWKTPLGIVFEAEDYSSYILLNKDLSIYAGRGNTLHPYKNASVNLLFRLFTAVTYSDIGPTFVFGGMGKDGSVEVQGKTVKLGENPGEVAVYPDGRLAYFSLTEQLKLITEQGKEKLFKGRKDKPIRIILNQNGLVIEKRQNS